MKQKVIACISILAGALILLYPVLLNQYPLVCADSGTYIKSGFLGKVPYDRPIVYGLLVEYLSLGASLFLYVFAQSLIVSASIYITCRQLIQNPKRVDASYWICLSIIACFTGMPWFASWIMPDIYAGISAMLLLVLLFSPVSLKQNGWLVLLYYSVTLTHLSNILTHTLLIGMVVGLIGLNKLFKRDMVIASNRIWWLTVIVGLSFGLMICINYRFERKVVLSEGSTLFLSAKFCDYGLLNEYLDKHCADEHYRICDWKDSLSPDLSTFLWSPNSVLYKMGWWPEQDAEFARINKGILSDPKMLCTFFNKGFEGSLKQFGSIEVGSDFMNFGDSSTAPYRAINRYFPKEIKQYENSGQNTSSLEFPFELINQVQYCLLWVVLAITALLLTINIPARSKLLLWAVLLVLVSNAMVCAFFSTVEHRYQGRIVWLLVLIVIVEMVNNREYMRQLFRKKIY